jgi:hypothetical protein
VKTGKVETSQVITSLFRAYKNKKSATATRLISEVK